MKVFGTRRLQIPYYVFFDEFEFKILAITMRYRNDVMCLKIYKNQDP